MLSRPLIQAIPSTSTTTSPTTLFLARLSQPARVRESDLKNGDKNPEIVDEEWQITRFRQRNNFCLAGEDDIEGLVREEEKLSSRLWDHLVSLYIFPNKVYLKLMIEKVAHVRSRKGPRVVLESRVRLSTKRTESSISPETRPSKC